MFAASGLGRWTARKFGVDNISPTTGGKAGKFLNAATPAQKEDCRLMTPALCRAAKARNYWITLSGVPRGIRTPVTAVRESSHGASGRQAERQRTVANSSK